jgi:cytochrome c oxidase cbb3-type subunit 3
VIVERAALIGAVLFGLSACRRDERDFGEPGPGATMPQGVPFTELAPGPPVARADGQNPVQTSAYAISQGQTLYEWFNCVGCHAHGGGSMGPALMDEAWIYGGKPEQIFTSIARGRPNGMPAFGERIPIAQIWQIVAYVQSLSGNVPKDVAPSRADSMQTHEPPSMTKRRAVVESRSGSP